MSKIIDLRRVTTIKVNGSNGVPHQLSCRKPNEIPIKEGSMELINQPLTMALSVHHFRNVGSIKGGCGISPLIYPNLGPKSIVGSIQLDVDRNSRGFCGQSRWLDFGKSFGHLSREFREERIGLRRDKLGFCIGVRRHGG